MEEGNKTNELKDVKKELLTKSENAHRTIIEVRNGRVRCSHYGNVTHDLCKEKFKV